MFFRFFAFKVIVFNLSHHILGKGQVAANEVAFVAFAGKFLPGAVHGRIDLGWCTKVIVFGKEAPRTCFGGFCSIPAHVDDIAIVIRIGVLSFFEGIVIPFEIHGANLELSNFVVGTGVPNGVVAVYHDLLIIILCGYEAVHFLYKKGCRHIGLITGSLKLSPYKFRFQGYRDAMMELGMREFTAEAKRYSNQLDYGYTSTKEMLKIHPELDAIIAAMDAQGIGALRALKEARKKVPGDVRVISLTGHELGSMLETTMTTMEMPAVEIGKKAAQLVLAEIEANSGGDAPVERVVYTSKLIEREST